MPGEFAVSGIIAFVAFVVLGSFTLDVEKRDWADMHKRGVIDKREYYDNRFKFF